MPILRSDANPVALAGETIYRIASLPMARVPAVDSTEQDVRVGKDVHLSRVLAPLVFARIDALSGESLIR